MQTYMVVDIDSCWGCKSCTVSCKSAHSIPPGQDSCISVFRIETESDGEAACDYIPVMCQQCSNPQCMDSCPVNAVYRTDEGLVAVDAQRCIGCGKCTRVCPYGAVAVRKDGNGRKVAYKCDLCVQRRAHGGKTFCEQHCPGQVFSCVDKARAEELMNSRKYRYSIGRVVYVSDILENLGANAEGE